MGIAHVVNGSGVAGSRFLKTDYPEPEIKIREAVATDGKSVDEKDEVGLRN